MQRNVPAAPPVIIDRIDGIDDDTDGHMPPLFPPFGCEFTPFPPFSGVTHIPDGV